MLPKGWMCPKGIRESFWDTSGAPRELSWLFSGHGAAPATSSRWFNCSPAPLQAGQALIEKPNEVPGVSCRDGAN